MPSLHATVDPFWAQLVAGWADHLDAAGANLLIDGTPAPLTHAKTFDYGLRYSMPGGKAYLTVTHYNTDQQDIPNDFGSVTDIRNIWTNLGYTDPLLVGGTSFAYKDPADRKLRGWEVLDEGASLADAGATDGSIFLLTHRRRRPVK